MCAGMPPRQRSAVGGRHRHRHHILVVCHHLTVDDPQRDDAVGLGRRLHLPDGTGDRPQRRNRGIGDAEHDVVARRPEMLGGVRR